MVWLRPETLATLPVLATPAAATTKCQEEGSTALMADTRQIKLNVSGWELEGISISGQVHTVSSRGPR